MSTHKLFDRICIFITILGILLTVLFTSGSIPGIAADDSVTLGYEDTLFDDSYVHTIDIEMDDWDSFIENATSEEYSAANVTIDGETVKNVGIRGKGNTSLSTVAQLDSERYSLKIEFDAYQSSGNYHGLDKLCLNNLIQDYSMMKDYLTYKLMNEFGADAPLVSYAYITVNGEDWGLYLAVEAVEDSFLERTNGKSYGNLYKPDSMDMGGGRGNGGGFDMKNVDFDKMGMSNPFNRGNSDPDDDSSDSDNDNNNIESPGNGNAGFPGGFDGDMPSPPEGFDGEMPGGMGMGSSDAKLMYIDDDEDSYSTIFSSAKTNIQTSDKKRLINSLKTLSEGIENGDAEQIAEAVDVDAVMRYMVVHNFVVNGDSYTGSMIHNYYLYEEDGLLSMIPWDYNLAFGTFQANDATSAVNDPIDTPLSVTEDSSDRPMFSWITSNEEYLELYHEYYEEFIEQFYESSYLADLIDNTYEMIAEYVDKDPTKFCTTKEFDTAVDTMKSFVELRCQSIRGQLDGSIGSTDSAQDADPDSLIDASSLNLSAMGSMGGGMGGFPGKSNKDITGTSDGADSSVNAPKDSDTNTPGGFPGGDSNFPGGFGNMQDFTGTNSFSSINTTSLIYLGACAGTLLLAIFIARRYRVRV
ncbi:CotH kinase family protein [Butyrivibrio sp. MC2013]|uniref:CotH kinase family protein n=1 Tax=Butyrivibrio sp. MC2013 TaxID=1280686 RepID=UPI000409B4BA|nr:CotH kinase family protein [Butyrivibrio sp. MC2013]